MPNNQTLWYLKFGLVRTRIPPDCELQASNSLQPPIVHMQLHPKCGAHFHVDSNAQFTLACIPTIFSKNAVFMISYDNLKLHNLHFVTAHLCIDNLLFWTVPIIH